MPFCTRVTPLVDTLMFCPGAPPAFLAPVAASDEVEVVSADAEESAGFAEAIPGMVAIPAPMPRKTASAPTRPM